MIRTFIAAAALMLIAGCSSPQHDLVKDAHEAVKRELNDPESAIFDRQMPPMVFQDLGLVCGSVDAKNAMGGYGGDQVYAYSRDAGAVVGDPSSPSNWDRYLQLQRRCLQASENETAKMQGRKPRDVQNSTDQDITAALLNDSEATAGR